MAAAQCLLKEEQFLCSICLEVFTEPVSTPCGHNFCKSCITQNWNYNLTCGCPVCKRAFVKRPDLNVNTLLSEMVSQFKQEADIQSQQVSKPGDVSCDVCSVPKLKAVKSCLVCLSSYCETHLQPHQTVSGLKRHQLIEPVENLEDRTCPESVRLVEERQKKIQEIRSALELSRDMFQMNQVSAVDVLAELRGHIQQSLDTVVEKMREAQRLTEKRAEDMIQELQREICDLQEAPLQNQDSLRNWAEVWLELPIFEQMLSSATISLQKTLAEKTAQLSRAELSVSQKYAVDVTLDRDTAHPFLALSEDLKQVWFSSVRQDVPDIPQRFTVNPCVLGREGFSSGRFYFEVEVRGKTEWDLGVARESILRKQDVPLSPDDGYWCVWLRNRRQLRALENESVRLHPRRPPQKVGVFVDYSEGLVSFYDVDSADLIYSFTGCCFREKLFPYFGPGLNVGGKNSSPLISCHSQRLEVNQ